MRKFSTGATRDGDEGKLDYEGFSHPLVEERIAQYMHKHRIQADGNTRASDNWQAGIPRDAYMKSAFRHFMDVWKEHRGIAAGPEGIEDAICGVIFNMRGLLLEVMKPRLNITKT